LKAVLALYGLKKIPECNVLVGTNDVLIDFAQRVLNRLAEKVNSVTDAMVLPGKLYRVDAPGGVEITQEKILAKTGVWDVTPTLEPGSIGIKDIVEVACKIADVKPTKELITGVQWKLFEGTGGITDIQRAIMEATMWAQLPLDPKPDLPWFNPEGWFRLAQIERELRGYQAFLDGDNKTMQSLGTKELKVSKWNLDPVRVKNSLDTLQGWREGHYTEETARFLLKYLWMGSAKKLSHKK
jgi:hypothetical protein